MKEIKKLKYQEPHEFKRQANEDQYEFNLKLAKPIDSAKSAAEKLQLEKVKTDLKGGEKLLVERQKYILLADKSEHDWSNVDKYKQHYLVDNSDGKKRVYVYRAERRARAAISSRKKKKPSAMAASKTIVSSRVDYFFKPTSVIPAWCWQPQFIASSAWFRDLFCLRKVQPLARLLPSDGQAGCRCSK